MEKKSLEDWILEKYFKSVKGVVDVSSFGGPTKEYQVLLDPEKLIAYGLSIGQVEQQLANNNTNGGGSFIEEGSQQINVQSLGLFTSVQDIENTVVKIVQRSSHQDRAISATVQQGPKIRLGQIGRAGTTPDGRHDRRQSRHRRRHRAAAKGQTPTRSCRAFTTEVNRLKAIKTIPAFSPRASRSFRSSTAPTW